MLSMSSNTNFTLNLASKSVSKMSHNLSIYNNNNYYYLPVHASIACNFILSVRLQNVLSCIFGDFGTIHVVIIIVLYITGA
jgi:hypothetical protein